MTDIVFAACDAMPDCTPSDARLAKALEARGARVAIEPWTGSQRPFADADLILVRATWDYAENPAAFDDWLAGLSAYGDVVNPPALMRWNMDKRYLLELADKGAPLPPTKAVQPDAASIAAALETLGLERAVVKPVFGAGASGLSIVRREDPDSIRAAAEKLGMDGLVQPFIPEIRDVGETSMIFVRGDFSHAVIKRPKAGDIRVQEEHGGRTVLTDPPSWAVAAGAEVLGLLPEPAFYARVDAVILDGAMRLMEVELIEPELFFNYCPDAEIGVADRFAAALMERL